MIGAAVRRIWRARKLAKDRWLVINQLNAKASHEKVFKSPFESESYIGTLNKLEEDLSIYCDEEEDLDQSERKPEMSLQAPAPQKHNKD